LNNNIQETVIADLREQKIAILGLGVTSIYLVKFLCSCGINLTICDIKKAEELEQICHELAGLDVEYRLGENYMDNLTDFQLIFISPGINPLKAEIVEAKEKGVEFSSEIELLFELSKAPIVGITGSSGKTTTTTLTGIILTEEYENRGKKAYVGGNIGTPLIDKVLDFKETDIVLLELSSFQLKFMKKSAHIGAILNITPNHLDVHPDMQDYISSKENLVKYQSAQDVAIFNLDNEISAGLMNETEGKKMMFSLNKKLDEGAYLDGDEIVFASNGSRETICNISDVKIPGMHNVENVLAAIVISIAAGASRDVIRKNIKSFSGVSHRLEKVRVVNGVTYINDSISTTPSRAIAGIKAIDSPIIQIAGGYDKKLPFDEMADIAIERVKEFILLGNTAPKIEEALKHAASKNNRKLPSIHKAASLEEAIDIAAKASQVGDFVLLSPACASYDMFKNFEERGNIFKEIVNKL